MSEDDRRAHINANLDGSFRDPSPRGPLNPPRNLESLREPREQQDDSGYVPRSRWAPPETEAEANAAGVARQARIAEASRRVAEIQSSARGTPIGGPSVAARLRDLWRWATS